METKTNIQAIINYNKTNQKRISLAFYPPEHDLYEWLKTKENVNGFIKSLLENARNKELNIE